VSSLKRIFNKKIFKNSWKKIINKMQKNKNCKMINVPFMILILLSHIYLTLNIKTNKKLQSKLDTSAFEEKGEYKNVQIINTYLNLCITMNNNSQVYLASCNGSKNQQWNVKFERTDKNQFTTIINSHTGWALEYYITENPLKLEPFKRFSHQYFCANDNIKDRSLRGDPVIVAPMKDKHNQIFGSPGSDPQIHFTITLKKSDGKYCDGVIAVDLEDPNYSLGVYLGSHQPNTYLSFFRVESLNFSEEAKNKFEQRPQILRNYQSNECVTAKKNGEVYFRKCLGLDNQLWFTNDQGNRNYEIRNKDNSLSLDVDQNKLISSALNESNIHQTWNIEYSPNYSGYFMIVNKETKKCVSINSNDWNDDNLTLESCNIFNKMQNFKFEIYHENELYYENIMPINDLETRYLVNKGTGLCVEIDPILNEYKNVECKDIPEQRIAILKDENPKDIPFYGFNIFLLYHPFMPNPRSLYPYGDKVQPSNFSNQYFLRYTYSEIFPNTFQILHFQGNSNCFSVKDNKPTKILYSIKCDPSDVNQHWQLVRVKDYGKDLSFNKPAISEKPLLCPESPVVEPQPQENEKFLLEGELRNATNNLMITESDLEGLVMEFKNNDGKLFSTTNVGARYSVSLEEGAYTVTIKTKVFSEYTDEILIENKKNQIRNFLLSPSAKGLRVVLVWNDNIRDLDLIATSSKDEKITYKNKASNDGTIRLDIDKRDGFGPETITVSENNKDDKITFTVHNFSNETHFSQSEAHIQVYLDNKLIQNFKIPNTSGNPDARLWEVGVFDRTANKFNKINQVK